MTKTENNDTILSTTTTTNPIDVDVVNSPFCAEVATKTLRVTCYGSSSSKTPERYLREARSVGYILAQRGHICVNGAGSYGCMAAMNDGCLAGNGHVVGVIHEMFLVDNGYWGDKTVIRDGGAHRVFDNARTRTNKNKKEDDPTVHDDNHKQEATISPSKDGPIREILVAGGDDLQERKKLLVTKADGLIVLPGGPGTWDELWEMACARHLNLNQLPIVCVNVDGFYEPFRQMLERAYDDELIKLPPHEIVHFAPTAEAAVRWIEGEKKEIITTTTSSTTRTSTSSRKSKSNRQGWKKNRTTSFIRLSSFFSASPYQQQDTGSSSSRSSSYRSDGDGDDDDDNKSEEGWSPWIYLSLAFVSGTVLGVVVATTTSIRTRR